MSGKILVIKHGALGDFIQAAVPFAAIRNHHHRSAITLLTTIQYAEFAVKSHWFDEIWVDQRPKLHYISGWFSLRSRLRAGRFSRVYDLQTSRRSSYYYRLFWPDHAPEWSGVARGCSLPHANPDRNFMHTMDRQAEQLAIAGLSVSSAPVFSWIRGDIYRFNLKERFVILVPGGASHRTAKRWPLECYNALARELEAKRLVPVIIGSETERELGNEVLADCDMGHNLAGQTSLEDLFLLAREADYAVGNDTGPMHIFAAQGCKTLVLFSNESDPALCAQRGKNVTILRRTSLANLNVKDVTVAMSLSCEGQNLDS